MHGTIRALSFDIYGTLIDWETGIAAFLHPWANAQGCALDTEQLLVAYAGHEADAERRMPDSRYPLVLAAALSGLAAELGLTATDEDQQTFGRSVPGWPAFGDSAAALQLLSSQCRLIALSNVDRTGFAASSARLQNPFDDALTAEDIGSYKPNPRNFAALADWLKQLGIAPDAHLHVAQSLFHDHVPAKAAGMCTVWINRRHHQPGWGATPDPLAEVTPDYVFESMAEFAAALTGEALETGRRR